jgi:hypothetical protein
VTWDKPVQGAGVYKIDDVSATAVISPTDPKVVIVTANVPFTPGSGHFLAVTGEYEKDTAANVQLPEQISVWFVQGDLGKFCANFEDGLVPAGTSVAAANTVNVRPPYVGPDNRVPPLVTGQFMHLTDAINDQNNWWTIPISPQNLAALHATWKTLLGGGSADGMSFNVGTAMGVNSFAPEAGTASGLSTTIDTYDNGGLEVGISIKWNGTRIAYQQIGGGGTGNPQIMRNVFEDTVVDVNASGLVTFTYGPFTISGQITNYAGINANMYVFAGRTGGANENAWIDDLCINDIFTIGPMGGTITPAIGQAAVAFPVTFTANAAGSPPYTLQWYSNNVAIPGAIGLTHTTPPLTADNNGDSYTCVARNAFSEATLGPATIEVLPEIILMGCATMGDPVNVYVTWNKPVAEVPTGIYTISGATVVSTARMESNPNVVVVTTTGLAPDANYTMEIDGETDPEGNLSNPLIATCSFSQPLGKLCTDFSTGIPAGTIVLAAGVNLTPPAVGEDGSLHLTEQLNDVRNYWIIPLATTEVLPNLKAKWRTFLAAPGGADGFSFNVGLDTTPADPFPYQDINAPENGATVGLSVTVDTYNSGINDFGFEILWNGARLAYTPSAGAATCTNCGAQSDINNNQWVDTSVDVTPSGFVTFKHGTFTTTAQIPNFTGIPANKYEFGARTGGANEKFYIDDFCIQNYNLGPVDVAITPADPRLLVTQSGVLSATLLTGSPWLTYQWYSNGIALAGAVSETLVVPPVSLADNGTVYSVAVSNAFSGDTASATLSVPGNPFVVQADSLGDPNHVYVMFNTPVNLDGSYAIDGVAVEASSVAYGANQQIVVLTAATPIGPGAHTVLIDSVTGASDSSLLEPLSTTKMFTQQAGYFCADFNDNLLPPGTTETGGVYVNGQYMHLTDTTNNLARFWSIPVTQFTVPAFKARWRTQLGPNANANRADGMSFNVGQNLTPGFNGPVGSALGLSATIDTYNNGGSEVGIYVKWNGTRLGFTRVGGDHGARELLTGSWVDSSLEVTPSGFVVFKHNTFVVSGQIPNYTGLTANTYIFAANTGGANENAWIDDVCVNPYSGPAAVTITPSSLSVIDGRPVNLVANADGALPYAYQWLTNGVPVAGANTPLYSFYATPEMSGVAFTVAVSNLFSSAVSAATTVTVLPVPTEYGMGALMFEVYNDIDGTAVSALTSNAKFPSHPSAVFYLPRFDTRAIYSDNRHDLYGGRISGLYYPPVSGNYVFWLYSDDSSELYLNPTGTDPAGKVKILEDVACCAWRTTNVSYQLVAGQAYYIEGLYKEGGGGDLMQVVAGLAGSTPQPTNATLQTIQGINTAALIDPTANAAINITAQPTNACKILQPAAPPAMWRPMLAEDFTADNGLMWVTNFPSTNATTLPPGPWTWSDTTGSWSCYDREACDPKFGPYASMLVTPPMVVPNTGGVGVSFNHRYNGEAGAWDGGLVMISVNGGTPAVVPSYFFTSNGYNGIILGNTVLNNRYKHVPAFVNTSTGYATPEYLTSEAVLGYFKAGDVLNVGFLYSWDNGCAAPAPNWEIQSVEVVFGTEVPVTNTFIMNAAGTAYSPSGPFNASITPAYQWQVNTGSGFVNIPGANTRTYATPFLALADSGTQYRVVATLPGVTATTTPAVLTTIAGCGLASVTRTAQGIDIVWNSVSENPADWCTLEGTTEFVKPPGTTTWEPLTAVGGDVLVLEPGHAVLSPTTTMKFFRLKAPVQCP